MIKKRTPTYPWLASRILEKIVIESIRDGVVGDFNEHYVWICENKGHFIAWMWVWLQILQLAPQYIQYATGGRMALLITYFKLTFRNIRKKKVLSTINIFGLAMGMACCIAIFLFVQQELSYDGFHENGNRIYRLLNTLKLSIGDKEYAKTSSRIGPLLKSDFPEIEDFTRFTPVGKKVIDHDEKKFSKELYVADPQFFEIFTFPLMKGDPHTALVNPSSLVISLRLANELFGETDPFGKTVLVDGEQHLKITGVMEDIPENSHLQFDMVAPLSFLKHIYGEEQYNEGSYLASLYLLFKENIQPGPLQAKLPNFVNANFSERYAGAHDFYLQDLKSIHLKPGYLLEISKTSDKKYIYYFSIIACFMLIIACVNFINFMLADSINRSKEVGIRKTAGAGRMSLVRQFMMESMLMVSISVLLAIMVVSISIPFINDLFQLNLRLDFFQNPSVTFYLLALTIFVGILASSYPAFVISAHKPMKAMKDSGNPLTGNHLLKKVFVVIQFTVSLIFIVYTIVVSNQMRFIKNKDLYFKPNDLIYFPLDDLKGNAAALKQELLNNPNIMNVTTTEFSLGRSLEMPFTFTAVRNDQSMDLDINILNAGPDFFRTLNVPILRGREFSSTRKADIENTVVINESAANMFGWDDPIGKQIVHNMFEQNLTIIGVVPDFHVESLRKKIQPYVFYYHPGACYEMMVKIDPHNVSETIDFIQQKWLQFLPGKIFTYEFADKKIGDAYQDDDHIGTIFSYASMLAILIASLGLFGLVFFSVEKRTKEIGVRKTLGASVPNIILLIVKEYFSIMVISTVIALPIAYFVSTRWLQSYAYKINPGIGVLCFSTGIVFTIALLTVSYGSLKAALANPAEALKYE